MQKVQATPQDWRIKSQAVVTDLPSGSSGCETFSVTHLTVKLLQCFFVVGLMKGHEVVEGGVPFEGLSIQKEKQSHRLWEGSARNGV